DVSDECSEISLCAATESTRGTSEKLLPAPKTFLITSLKSYLAQSTFTLFKKYYLISPHTPSTEMLLLISRNRVRGYKLSLYFIHCVDEIHTVVSAFHAATELDPQLHTRFALQTISYLYKNLRERISKKILMMGSGFRERQREVSRRLNLPPALPSSAAKTYPKDSEKHLLAIRSGLKRSQVSNWFINARVRLWKPMIEDMYAEMNKRKLNNTHLQGGNGGSIIRVPKSVMMSQESDKIRE
ncbi:unnamed protein product, partial [Brassica oleracea]